MMLIAVRELNVVPASFTLKKKIEIILITSIVF